MPKSHSPQWTITRVPASEVGALRDAEPRNAIFGRGVTPDDLRRYIDPSKGI